MAEASGYAQQDFLSSKGHTAERWTPEGMVRLGRDGRRGGCAADVAGGSQL